jgi:hypothetical protein
VPITTALAAALALGAGARAGATGAVGAASGTRAFIAGRHFSWLTPRRLRVLTIVLLTAALLASATLVSCTEPRPVSR